MVSDVEPSFLRLYLNRGLLTVARDFSTLLSHSPEVLTIYHKRGIWRSRSSGASLVPFFTIDNWSRFRLQRLDSWKHGLTLEIDVEPQNPQALLALLSSLQTQLSISHTNTLACVRHKHE